MPEPPSCLDCYAHNMVSLNHHHNQCYFFVSLAQRFLEEYNLVTSARSDCLHAGAPASCLPLSKPTLLVILPAPMLHAAPIPCQARERFSTIHLRPPKETLGRP